MLPRYVRLHHDSGRGRWVLLAPERIIEPNEIALDVLQLCDGARDLTAIAEDLASAYDAPPAEILADIWNCCRIWPTGATSRTIEAVTLFEKTIAKEEIVCASAPEGLLAELTHRCPLQCPYCSNPLELERVNREMSTDEWRNVFSQAAEMGVVQLHLSGGEPTLRTDLEDIVAHVRGLGCIPT